MAFNRFSKLALSLKTDSIGIGFSLVQKFIITPIIYNLQIFTFHSIHCYMDISEKTDNGLQLLNI